ncbi:MAG: FAD-dependent monooxygenase [Proteobacteria bacterium]|nr:FAD-dependent monooxygenase [Pseudomonadota bacterium]
MSLKQSLKHILIAGGGIGGLTAGIRLARAGFSVSLFEQAETFGGFGAGIQLSPNCVAILYEIGLARGLERLACRPERVRVRHWQSGRMITEAPLGRSIEASTGFPYFHIHRADLIELLLAEALEEPNLVLKQSGRVTGVDSDLATEGSHTDNIQISTTLGRYSADLLIGADGIHSVVRDYVLPDASPAFSGNVAWRATVPAAKLPPHLRAHQANLWWGPGAHVVHYPVRGGELVNLVCVVEEHNRANESWHEYGRPSELLARLAGWHEDILVLVKAIDDEACFKWGLFDRPPLQAWHRGRVVLLGDACHATLPFLAQGAAMAIEDAAVLTGCLQHEPTHRAALVRYQKLRLPRTSRVQSASRRNARVFHMDGPGTLARNLLSGAALGWTARWLYHYRSPV